MGCLVWRWRTSATTAWSLREGIDKDAGSMEHHGVWARHLIASRHVNFPLSRRHSIAIRRQCHVASAGKASSSSIKVAFHSASATHDGNEIPYHYFLSFIRQQSIIDTDDFTVVIASVRILCETVNEFLNRVTDTNRDDEQLLIKCDILR